MALLIRAAAFLAGVGGSLLVLWLAFTNRPLAWVALVVAGVVAVGLIVLIARHTWKSMWKPDPARSAGQPAADVEEVSS